MQKGKKRRTKTLPTENKKQEKKKVEPATPLRHDLKRKNTSFRTCGQTDAAEAGLFSAYKKTHGNLVDAARAYYAAGHRGGGGAWHPDAARRGCPSRGPGQGERSGGCGSGLPRAAVVVRNG